MNTLETILERVIISETGCWLWTGQIVKNYGSVSWKSKTRAVHRVVYSLLVGDIPKGRHLHHTCEIKHCCNPDHLKIKTPKEHSACHDPEGNLREYRIKHGSQPYCKNGHEYTEENTRIDHRGYRFCRKCDVEKSMRWISNHLEQHKEYQDDYNKSYYQKNREKLLAKQLEYSSTNREKKRDYDKKRRDALKKQ